MRLRVALHISILAVVLGSPSGVARAAGPAVPIVADASAAARAAALKKKADAAMDALRYDEALAAYTEAYAASPDPALLYNRGRVHQARGEWPEALADFERFAHDASPELRARVPRLDDLLSDARAHVAVLRLQSNVNGARVLVRDRQVGTTPLPDQLSLAAGPARVEVLADGYGDWRQDVDLKGGATTVLDAVLALKVTTGVLRVRAATAGARVSVDDRPLGDAPAETQLPPGPHRVLVHAEGFDDRETNVVVVAGQAREVELEPEHRPAITSRWWFWTSIGVVLAAGAVTTVALLSEKSPGSGDHFQPGQVSGP